MKARPIAVVVVLFTFAWVALPFFATTDPGHRPDVPRNASFLEQSEATATIVVGDRVTKPRWPGLPIALGALGAGALALMTLRRLAAASIVGVTVRRPATPRVVLERGPPAF